jgi:hypothetical protein
LKVSVAASHRPSGEQAGDEGIRELTDLLTKNRVFPVLTRPDSGIVLVQMMVDATNDMAARAAAEGMLGNRAHEVWVALDLPPFTITFVDAKPKGDRFALRPLPLSEKAHHGHLAGWTFRQGCPW